MRPQGKFRPQTPFLEATEQDGRNEVHEIGRRRREERAPGSAKTRAHNL